MRLRTKMMSVVVAAVTLLGTSSAFAFWRTMPPTFGKSLSGHSFEVFNTTVKPNLSNQWTYWHTPVLMDSPTAVTIGGAFYGGRIHSSNTLCARYYTFASSGAVSQVGTQKCFTTINGPANLTMNSVSMPSGGMALVEFQFWWEATSPKPEVSRISWSDGV